MITPVDSAGFAVFGRGGRGTGIGHASIDEVDRASSRGDDRGRNWGDSTLYGHTAIDEFDDFGNFNFDGGGVVDAAIGELHGFVSR